MFKFILTSFFLIFALSLTAQKTWTGAMDATWANAGNWMPTGVPSSTDEVLFNNAASNMVTLAAATSVGQLKVSNNSTLILKSSVTASIDLTITGASGDDLVVGSGSTLNITSTSNVATEQIIQIVVPTTVTGSISGNMSFSNTGTAAIPHRLLSVDVNSIIFQNGSVFTAGIGFGGFSFGDVGGAAALPSGRVIFKSGSRYVSKSGDLPLGNGGYTGVTYFEHGSTYQHDQTTRPLIGGDRRFANFEYSQIVVQSQTLLSYRIDGNLTVKGTGAAILNPLSGSGALELAISSIAPNNDYKVAGDLIIESGGSLTIGTGTNVTCFIVKGNVIVKSGGTLKLGTQSSVNLLCISGNLLVEEGGSLIIGGGTSTNSLFLRSGYGNQIQTITNNSSTSSGIFSKLYLIGERTAAGVNSVAKLASNLEVQDLEFYGGNYSSSPCEFQLGNHDLKINGNLIGLFAFTRYIITNGTGKLKRPVGTTPVLFPVSVLITDGSGTKDFVTLTNTGTLDEFSVNVNPYSTDPSYNNVNIYNRIWNISEGTIGGSNVTMQLNAQTGLSTFVPSNVVLGHGNQNGTFNALPAMYVPNASFGGSLTANNVTTFSPFIIANDVALGVTLTNFSAQLTNKNTVMLNWQTENEKDNSGFEIQRSADAKSWEKIGFVKGKGQSNVAFDYTFEDKGPLSILTYYRLKQVDFNGKESYSKVVNIYSNQKNKVFSVYPNPMASNKINIELTSDRDDRIDFEVVDIVGKTIQTLSQNVTNGLNTIAFDNLAISKGIYFIRAKQNNVVTEVVRFVRL